MTSATEPLKDLHQLHLDIEQAQGELNRGPKQIQARKHISNKKETALKEFLDNLIQLKMFGDSKSLDLKTLENKLESLAAKLNIASSNREFNTIKDQIKADEMAKSVLEDELLEVFERIDEESAKKKDVEQQVEAAKQESTRFSEQFATRSTELGQHLEGLSEKLKVAEKILPSEPLADYRRLVFKKGAKAMAKLRGGACSNCFVSITAQQKILINTGEYVFCTSCGSLLYSDE
ncbi:MAG: hypothetical protein JKY95_18090 [Planctomycetaceae bacterium]|nr:hypothetical protein [Planctomycetaceae bacterium]